MAANCTADNVRLIIDTDLEDPDIETLIDLADAEITARSLDTRSANIKKAISMFLTAHAIAHRDPESQSIGDFSEKIRAPDDWLKEAERLISKTGDLPFLTYNEPVE